MQMSSFATKFLLQKNRFPSCIYSLHSHLGDESSALIHKVEHHIVKNQETPITSDTIKAQRYESVELASLRWRLPPLVLLARWANKAKAGYPRRNNSDIPLSSKNSDSAFVTLKFPSLLPPSSFVLISLETRIVQGKLLAPSPCVQLGDVCLRTADSREAGNLSWRVWHLNVFIISRTSLLLIQPKSDKRRQSCTLQYALMIFFIQ